MQSRPAKPAQRLYATKGYKKIISPRPARPEATVHFQFTQTERERVTLAGLGGMLGHTPCLSLKQRAISAAVLRGLVKMKDNQHFFQT